MPPILNLTELIRAEYLPLWDVVPLGGSLVRAGEFLFLIHLSSAYGDMDVRLHPVKRLIRIHDTSVPGHQSIGCASSGLRHREIGSSYDSGFTILAQADMCASNLS